ncbi:hypothetical protein LQE93_14040 [Clostridium sp. NSJ-145]|uniref:hypothetical protein n=1 Tax=Clostridium sp. NSJ-145 TaxID=2897777 RepID=UPI001E3F6413|nr:hypothetical protein [Clostridium sp. NSJ-145]MCD2502888.1 hypothetical protein [Clostridium sp. NSJ-145]
MKRRNFIFLFIVSLLVLTLIKLSTNIISTLSNTSSINTLNNNLDYSKVPYISTYYFDFKPTINDNVIIPLYITNYDQSEYLNNEIITLDLEYEIDGLKYKLKDVKAGDNTLNIGKLSEGEHYFSLQAIDQTTGLKSHKLYNEILVINPENYTITDNETYIISESDLLKYKISNKNSTIVMDMTNTRLGLSKLFSDLQSKGYRKCILPKGIYRIDNAGRYESIAIPSNFTVDMNGSTFKLNTVLENDKDASIVYMDNTYDSHLINGTLEGDKNERDELGLNVSYNGEAINTIAIKGGKYSSIENLTIKQTTGHTVGAVGVNLSPPRALSNFSEYLVINDEIIDDNNWSTSDLLDISEFISNKYITIGRYLGYRGVIGNSLALYINFYDENEEFIETIVGYQYRKTLIPENSKYIRVSMLGDIIEEDNVCAFYNELGTNWTYSNIDFIDTRTTAIATATCNNILIQNCTFTRCGKSITPSIVDFEDGWQECQDVYFLNNARIGNSIGTADIIDNSGYNHIYENNSNIGYVIRYSVVGLVIRNNDEMLGSRWTRGYETGSKFGRIYNNIITGVFNSSTDDNDMLLVLSLVKYSAINCTSLLESSTESFSYENCDIYNFNGSRVKAINCNIYPSPYLGDDFIFTDCTFYPLKGEEKIKMSFNKFDSYREFNNCIFTTDTDLVGHNQFNSGIFNDCVFEDNISIAPNSSNKNGDLQFNNCIFNGTLIVDLKDEDSIIVFNNCKFLQETNLSNFSKKNIIIK